MLFNLGNKPLELPTAAEALPDREQPLSFNPRHFCQRQSNRRPGAGTVGESSILGSVCFWGAERPVLATARSLSARRLAMPVATRAIHPMKMYAVARPDTTEAVLVYFDPELIGYEDLLRAFWEEHDPTQGMRQGNDIGTQYRSAIYTTSPEQEAQAQASKQQFQSALQDIGRGDISTEIKPLSDFFYAEDYHQQYLAKNPGGYCGLAGNRCLLPTGGEFSGPSVLAGQL